VCETLKAEDDMKLALLALSTYLLVCFPTKGQEPTWAANGNRLKAQIKLDRYQYLAGESARVSIRLENPESAAIEAPDPLRSPDAGLMLYQKQPISKEQPKYKLIAISPAEAISSKSVVVQPGNPFEQSFQLHEPAFGKAPVALLRGGVPWEPGEYQIRYGYQPKATADFVVTLPALLLWKQFPEYEVIYYDRDTRRTSKVGMYLNVFVVGDGDMRHVCVDARSHTYAVTPPTLVDRPARTTDMRTLSPYLRIATAKTAVLKIDAFVQKNGDTAVLWSETDGKSYQVLLDKDRKIKDETKAKSEAQ